MSNKQIKIDQGNDHSSTLLIEGDKLTALGVISHGRSFAPATEEDAQALRDWLDQYRAPVEPWAEKLGAGCYSCIKELVKAYTADHDRLEELRDERDGWTDDDRTAEDWAKHHPDEAEELAELIEAVTLDGYEVDREQAIERIMNDPLSLGFNRRSKKKGRDVARYYLLLGTGGPAYRITGEIHWNEPGTAQLEVQDWGKPWTVYPGADEAVLLAYAECAGVYLEDDTLDD